MSRLLKETQRPDGMTELTLDINGVRAMTLSVPTVIRAEISSTDLDNIALRIAESSNVARDDYSTEPTAP